MGVELQPQMFGLRCKRPQISDRRYGRTALLFKAETAVAEYLSGPVEEKAEKELVTVIPCLVISKSDKKNLYESSSACTLVLV